MTAEQGSFLLLAYAPALGSDDSRPLVVVHAMERAMPGLRLEWTIADEGGFIPVPQDEARGMVRLPDGTSPLFCNGEREHLVSIYSSEIPAGLSPGGRRQFEVNAEWPVDAGGLAAAAEVLEGVAEGARAYWGHATPRRAAGDIARQTSPTLAGPPNPPRGLPALKLSKHIRAPEIPRWLGWLNYWSAAAAQAIGFPDPTRDAELLSRSRRTVTGGWVVRLTEMPLDLDNPAHLQALLRGYERFPVIGGRATP